MIQVISSEKIPIKSWVTDLEQGALDQAINLANLPFAFKHVALMPDAHQGYGMPIGGVLATKDVIIPNAVGVDIGCGMCAVKTSLTELSKDDLKKIFGGSTEHHGGIRSAIPVGFSHHSKKQDDKLMPQVNELNSTNYPIVCEEYEAALKQIGTLGGGNHFIEIQKGNDGHIWIMIHSGSRNIGFKVAEYYNKLATEMNEKWQVSVPLKWQLAFFPTDFEQGQRYLNEMRYCVEFALASRKHMMDTIKQILIEFVETEKKDKIIFDEMINIAHNYASIENHFGENVWVHRKGATLAREGTIGIIPGSQGTSSYIVKGKGNQESFMSCSHGAGRKMGRKEAQRSLKLEEEIKRLDDQGILHAIRGTKDLDEAAGAYKSIDVVMENQKDLVDKLVALSPLAVIKG